MTTQHQLIILSKEELVSRVKDLEFKYRELRSKLKQIHTISMGILFDGKENLEEIDTEEKNETTKI